MDFTNCRIRLIYNSNERQYIKYILIHNKYR